MYNEEPAPFDIVFLVLFPTPGKANKFFVAPDGGDFNLGTLKRPFATLERAQRAAQFQRRK